MNCPVTADRWERFLALVKDVRETQRHFRKTQDARVRHQLVRLEDLLDATAAGLSNDLAAGAKVVELVPQGTEGGAL